jgi:hypothetical protein
VRRGGGEGGWVKTEIEFAETGKNCVRVRANLYRTQGPGESEIYCIHKQYRILGVEIKEGKWDVGE